MIMVVIGLSIANIALLTILLRCYFIIRDLEYRNYLYESEKARDFYKECLKEMGEYDKLC